MKLITHTLGLIPVLMVLTVLNACRHNDMIPTLNDYFLKEYHYLHEHPTGTILSAEFGEVLLTLVKISVLEDSTGNHTIVIGEPSPEDTRVYFMGSEDGFLQFRLVPGGGSLSNTPAADQLVQFPEGTIRIELWGTPMEVLSIKNGRLRCRIAGPALTI